MKYKIIITIILFIFSFLYVNNVINFIRDNDSLMKEIKANQDKYNIKPIDAIITEHTMIPRVYGKKINLKKSYSNMKGINKFKENLLIFDEIKPNISIENIYDKIIISGNPKNNKVSLLTSLDNKYCYTENLTIKKECIQNKMHTILIHKINNNYFFNVKSILKNGIIIYLESIKEDDYNLITKYIISNNYEIVKIDELIAQ